MPLPTAARDLLTTQEVAAAIGRTDLTPLRSARRGTCGWMVGRPADPTVIGLVVRVADPQDRSADREALVAVDRPDRVVEVIASAPGPSPADQDLADAMGAGVSRALGAKF